MKEVKFKYYGGIESVNISTNASNTSLKVQKEYPCDWLSYSIFPTSISISATENSYYEDRVCRLTIFNTNGNRDSIEIKQDGYRNLLVDLSLYAIIPYTYYSDHETYDLPIRIYGGSGEFTTHESISDKIEKVFDDSDLYNDYVFHISSDMNGTYTFKHKNRDAYIEYCKQNNIEYDEANLEKSIVVRNLTKDVMDGYTIFSYYGKEYVNGLPPIITVNHVSSTVVSIDYSCFFNSNMDFVENSEYEIGGGTQWLKTYYDRDNKKIYLKAVDKTALSDRRCTITVRNLLNPKQYYTAIVLQRKS